MNSLSNANVFRTSTTAAFSVLFPSVGAPAPRKPHFRTLHCRGGPRFRSADAMGASKSKPKLSQDDLDFLIKNTKFSERDIKKWYKGFIRNCPKGHLTKAQFVEVYKSFFPSGAAEKFCNHAFRTFDVDNSGYVDFKEFLMAVNVTSSGTPRQKLEWAFRMYDIDGSGSIEEKEIVRILESIYEMLGPDAAKISSVTPKQRARMIFQKMDTNRDKTLTLKEFIDGCIADKELYQLLTNNANQ